jgi:peptidoglycan/LPS O-acetylase OafA/YrhL
MLIADALMKGTPWSPCLHKTGIMLGVAAALYVTKCAARSERWTAWLLTLGSASFFVFATHQPLLTILRKVLHVALLPTTAVGSLALHFLLPVALIAILVILYYALRALAPRFVGMVTGGRYTSLEDFGVGCVHSSCES